MNKQPTGDPYCAIHGFVRCNCYDHLVPSVFSPKLIDPNLALISKGWICPKCDAIYSPTTMECHYCNSQKPAKVDNEKT